MFWMTLFRALCQATLAIVPQKKKPEENVEGGGGVEAVILVSQEQALKLLLTSVLGAQSFGPSVTSVLQ